ncbi:class I SAM-dependent methyltransferase [Chitinibacter tainanensis]|uniref:class I SAM-dependent methyltransferase n=1 Tax=Chitinibacter tainanensis TaxID=230667 RepID=UPI0005512F4F|nr:SAM-dependent methyltransferase [Chitinibacter tainanensis]
MRQQEAQLPAPSAEALASSQQLLAHIATQITAAGGWISFADYMRLALYSPGLGYYTGGAAKFGTAGDFITAPGLSPLFGGALAHTISHVLAEAGGTVLEIGAGTGQLAAQILAELERLEQLPAQYAILELSAELQERQLATLRTLVPHLAERVVWLERLPAEFTGVMVGNEVLDAMPCEVMQLVDGVWQRRGVCLTDGQLSWANRPCQDPVLLAHCARWPQIDGYCSEIQLEAQGFIRALGQSLQRGLILMLDYGFPAGEFYHPERRMGTLIGHYRHHTVHDPFFHPGLTDLTCHVDFSAMYTAADQAGLALDGYTSQASYLIDCGILEQARQLDSKSVEYLRTAAALQKLLGHAEMGELFKAIAFSRGLSGPTAPGFRQQDRSGEL